MRLHKQRHERLSFLAGVVAGLLISMTALAAWRLAPAPQALAASPGDPITSNQSSGQEPVNVLILGVDERSGDQGRSDTMLLARFDAGQVRMLSIPRDTMVAIPGHGSEDKINSAYTYGGPELAKQTVSGLLGMPVQYYVKVNMAGFQKLVDLIGGVDFNVPKAMKYDDPTDGLHIDLQPGLQHLNGEKAEELVRFRHDEVGDDMGRIGRQQEFLKAAARQALTLRNLPRLPQLLYTAAGYVESDVPLTQQLQLARDGYAAQQRDAVLQETVPGHGGYVDGISYYLVDKGDLTRLVEAWRAQTGPS
jgi:polyisoprenyl-teichoic acid--peptidoglycan teichoic acid transferase